MERIKSENIQNKEIYADYFSKLSKSSQGLISSIQKFIESDLCTERILFELRLGKLNSDEIFLGEINFIN